MSLQKNRRPTGAVVAAAALAAALAALPAAAADPAPKKRAPAKSAPTAAKPDLMSRDELRACMNEQDRLQQLGEKVRQEQAALDRLRDEVKQIDADVATRRAGLDPAADEAARQTLIADLTRELTRRDEIADQYNERLPAVREQGTAYESSRQAWAQRCGNRNFDEMDEAAIRKERRQAGTR